MWVNEGTFNYTWDYEGSYWSTGRTIWNPHYAAFRAIRSWEAPWRSSIRLASVVSEDLTEDVYSVPSCCWVSQWFVC